MTEPPKRRKSERKTGFWLPAVACLLLTGTVWLGFQQVAQQAQTDQLFAALQSGKLTQVRAALDSGASANASAIGWGTAPAEFSGKVRQWFVQVMHPQFTKTALTMAAEVGEPKCVRLLLDNGANPNRCNGDGSTTLMRVTGLISYSGGPFFQRESQRRLQIMQMLLDKGADINAHDQYGRTALSNSVSTGYGEAMDLTVPRFLLAHGANVNAKDEGGETMFQTAVQSGDNNAVPFVSLLLDHGADVNSVDGGGGTPLQRASERINPALVQVLLNHGANPNVHSPANDMTPLIQAARQGQIGTMKLLLSKGADVNAFSKFDSTALFVAAQHKRADMVKLLLEHGANPNFINQFEMCAPALVVAAGNNDEPSVKTLLAHGADANLGSTEDDTPLTAAADECLSASYAKRHHNVEDPGDLPGLLPVSPPCGIEVTQMLLAARADPSKTNQTGNTALVYAVAGHNVPLVRLLLAHGANPTAHGANGYAPQSARESPLSLATERGYSDLLPLLRQNSHTRQNPHSVQ